MINLVAPSGRDGRAGGGAASAVPSNGRARLTTQSRREAAQGPASKIFAARRHAIEGDYGAM